jgi:hypothetical protein
MPAVHRGVHPPPGDMGGFGRVNPIGNLLCQERLFLADDVKIF